MKKNAFAFGLLLFSLNSFAGPGPEAVFSCKTGDSGWFSNSYRITGTKNSNEEP